MKITVEEKPQNNQNKNAGSNKNLNTNSNTLVSKDIDKATSDMRLSDSNLEYNMDESKNKDLRCLSCYLIPCLTLNSPTHTVNVNCNFGHSTTVDIEEYLQHGFDNNFCNLACSKCKTEILKNKKNFVYCKECSELLCKNCLKKHDDLYEENHHLVHLDKFDTTCILHNETYDYFCSDCKKNICQYCCDEFHSEHKLIDLDDINLKRKEIKKIKEHFTKEKENYLNVPKILNELVSKLKEDIDKIINNISNEIKFKESIINTYESKLDNYNAIINFKNLKFNTEAFTINKDLNNLENIIELIKYLNKNETTKTNDEKEKTDNLQKSSDKIKLKKKRVVNKSASSKKVNKNSNQAKANEANNNNADNENEINKENNVNNVENENNKEVNNNNSSKSNEKVYKKNIIQKKINNNNNNVNNNINSNNTNNTNAENSKKNLSKITENESSNSQNNTNNNNNLTQSKDIQETTNKKEDVSIPQSKNEKEENKDIENMKQKNNTITNNINNKIDNISKNIKNKVTSNSTNNLNYVRPESNVKLPERSNKSIHFDKNVDFKNRKQSKEKLSQHSKSQKSFTSLSNDPMILIKQLNEQKLPLENIPKQQQKIINNNRMIENKNREKKMMEEMKKMNMKQNNKKLREEYDDEDEDLDEEEEEEEDDEDEEDEEEEDSESEESEEDEKIVKKNRFKNSQKSDRILVKEEENDYSNLNINKEMAMEENDTSFRHKKIYPRSSLSTDNVDFSELFTRKKNLQNMKNNLGNNLNEKTEPETKTKIRIIRDMTVNEFRPNSSTLKIKESDNMVCCMLEVRDNIFACGFLLGQIDVYDINYLNCLFTIFEHKSRVSNMVLLKDKCILTSSFDCTMKKLRITNSNSYIVEFVFSVFKHVIYKGIELSNNNILAISFKGNIDIFRKTDKNSKYSNFISHEIAEEEIFNVIELYQNNEIAFSTDECLRFFSIDSFQNIGNVHLLEFAKGNNMLYMGKNNLIVMLRHHIGLVNIPQRQCIFKCSFGEAGKPECLCYLKDNTILMGVSNNIKENKTIEFIFKQYGLKMNKLKLISEKMEVIDKIKKDDYFRITSILELKNKVIAYGTAGFEEFKLVGNISIID